MKNWIDRRVQEYVNEKKKRKRSRRIFAAICVAILVITQCVFTIPSVALDHNNKSDVLQEQENIHKESVDNLVNNPEVTPSDDKNRDSNKDSTSDDPGDKVEITVDGSGTKDDLKSDDSLGDKVTVTPPDEEKDQSNKTDSNDDKPGDKVTVTPGDKKEPQDSGKGSNTNKKEEKPDETKGYKLNERLPSGDRVTSILKPESFGINLLSGEDTKNEFAIHDYITHFRVYYQDPNNEGKWIYITDETKDIPGNAKLRVEVDYDHFPIEKLLELESSESDGKKEYSVKCKLPDILKNMHNKGVLTSGSTIVGHSVVSDKEKIVTLSFYDSWIQEQLKKGHDVISGTAYVEGDLDFDKIEDGVPNKVVIGNVEHNLNFEKDIASKYGKIETTKTVGEFEKTAEGTYLTYKLNVSVPSDGITIPDVKIKDLFTSNKQYIDYYVGVDGVEKSTDLIDNVTEVHPDVTTSGNVYIGGEATEEKPIPDPGGTTYENPGTLVWSIGEMKPGETRTLTYRVKIKDEEIRVAGIDVLENKAETYSKTYKRDEVTAMKELKGDASISKKADSIYKIWKDEDGKKREKIIIEYLIEVIADSKNTHTLKNIKLNDLFDSKVLLEQGSYMEDSFELYDVDKDGNKNKVELKDVNPYEGKSNPQIYKSSFDLYAGDLKQGESKIVRYSVEVDAENAAIYGEKNQAYFNNKVKLFSDDAREETGSKYIKEAYITGPYTVKKWDRKLKGDKLESDMIIEMANGNVYGKTETNTPTLMPTPPENFTVPTGAYKYNVIVNEAGEWEVSGATLKDNFSSDYLKFTGYLKVSAYDIGSDKPSTNDSDDQVIGKLEGMTPSKTAWLDINEDTAFSFKPADLGLEGKYAYVLTYYAVPNKTEYIKETTVKNIFDISGDVVGPSGDKHTLPGMEVSVTTTVTGSAESKAEKMGWYSTTPSEEEDENYKNGALYWKVKLTGSIPQGFQVRDYAYYDNGSLENIQYIYDDAVVGVYQGIVGDFEKLKDIEELKANPDKFKPLTGNVTNGGENPENADYKWNRLNGGTHPNRLDVVFQKSFNLMEENKEGDKEEDKKAIYIIVKTSIADVKNKDDKKPVPEYYVARNAIATAYQGENPDSSKPTLAYMGIAQNGSVKKSAQGAYTYDGTTVKPPEGGNVADILKKGEGTNTVGIKDSGIYLSWLVRINRDGKMPDYATLKDMLPEGTELSYVRFYNLPELYDDSPKLDAEIAELEGNSSWEKNQIMADLADISAVKGSRQCTYYYNKETREVQWAVDGITNKKDVGYLGNNVSYIEFQIVAKVTDQAAILGQTKEFSNVVTVTDKNGREYTDVSPISITADTLKKVSEYKVEDGRKYPFKITINPLGVDLIKGTDTITLIDKLSASLKIEPESIEVFNSLTNTKLNANEYIPKVEEQADGQRLSIVIPDNIPLEITYDTFVNALPGQQVAISNTAYWEGYAPTDSTKVEDNEFEFAVGGTADTSDIPEITVLKFDENNTNIKLGGAEFIIQAVEWKKENNVNVFSPQGKEHPKTTGKNGEFIISAEKGDSWLEFNTIYRITEFKAPEGYVRSNKPEYFVIYKPKKDENGNVISQSYPTEEVDIILSGEEKSYSFYNGKGKIEIEKKFEDKNGESMTPPDGAYHFGIYETENPTGTAKQTLTIAYNGGVPDYNNPQFINLDINKTYYVYELDENNNPISEGKIATVNGEIYQVSYTGNGVNIGDGTTIPKVVITNRDKSGPEMPETGGIGINGYISAGLMLMLMAVLIYYIKFMRKGGMNKERS